MSTYPLSLRWSALVIVILSSVPPIRSLPKVEDTTAPTCKHMGPSDLESLYARVDERAPAFIKSLADAVKIPSVSSDPSHFVDLIRMINWTRDVLEEEFGFQTRVVYGRIDRGKAVSEPNNSSPFLLATSPPAPGSNGSADLPTLLVYGHLDVVAAHKSDGWTMDDPFVMERGNGTLRGRGVTDDKGPVVAWLNALRTLKEAGFCLPLNLKFFFETMEEVGSKGSQDLLNPRGPQAPFFADIDWAVVTDNYWLKPNSPALTYGLRGMVYFYVDVWGQSSQDLHSGVYGGSVAEPVAALVAILASLVDSDGRIMIEGIYDDVAQFGKKEREAYAVVHFDLLEYYSDIAAVDDKKLSHHGSSFPNVSVVPVGKSKIDVLASKWRQPTLAIHGIEGAIGEDGGRKSVIPHKVRGKFSIRLVPSQDPHKVENLVREHIKAFHSNWSANSSRKLAIKVSLAGEGVEAWYTQPWNNTNFACAKKAVRRVYGKSPDFTREGGSIPAVTYLTRVLPVEDSIILMPISSADDGAHSQNEKIGVSNFLNGTKLMITYIYEISKAGKNRGKRLWN